MKVSSYLLALGIALALLGGNAGAQMGNPMGQDIQSPVLAQVRIDQKLNSQVPLDLPFRDESGRTVKLGQFVGKKPVVMALVYYQCPMLCTEVLNGMTSSLRMLTFTAGSEFDVVAVSIDPRETPQMAAEKKAVYVKEYRRPGSENGWHFLVGDEKNIKALADSVGYHYAWDERSQQYAHPAAIMVLTADGKLAQYYYGIEYSPKDLRLALIEASHNRIGNVIDEAVLYCFHYDPTAGRYGLVITRALKLAGAATALILGGFLLVMFRAERKRPKLTPEDAVRTGRNS